VRRYPKVERLLDYGPLLLAHVGQTYTTPECLHFALRTFGNLLRTARLNLSIPTISRFARVATLLFCVALFNSFSSAAVPSQPSSRQPVASIPSALNRYATVGLLPVLPSVNVSVLV
jgi:hypothetical protein